MPRNFHPAIGGKTGVFLTAVFLPKTWNGGMFLLAVTSH
jgi:hypothetical protein